jgi:hypothetical protein
MRYFSVALLLMLTMGAGGARATPISFGFSYTGTGVTAEGELITDGILAGGFYTVTGITGDRNGISITALSAPGSLGGNDNLLSPGAPFVDNNGITYTAGGVSYNVYLSTNANSACSGVLEISSLNSDVACGRPTQVSLDVTPSAAGVPEPASLALFCSALAGLGWTRRQKKSLQSGS